MHKVVGVLKEMCCAAHGYYFYRKDCGLRKDVVKHVLKRISHELQWYDFYSTSFVFSIPESLGNRKQTTSLDKNHILLQIMRDLLFK